MCCVVAIYLHPYFIICAVWLPFFCIPIFRQLSEFLTSVSGCVLFQIRNNGMLVDMFGLVEFPLGCGVELLSLHLSDTKTWRLCLPFRSSSLCLRVLNKSCFV